MEQCESWVKTCFQYASHYKIVWTQLDRMGLSSRDISYLFYEALNKKRVKNPLLSDSEYFFEWGSIVLNAILNHHLERKPNHPTFQRMMTWLMEPVLKYRKEQEEKMRYSDHPDYRKR